VGSDILDDYVFDRMPPDVVVSAQICPGAQESAQGAVIECGEYFGEL
jgi:hypothetical protein